ncbi:conserved hypothetical protein [Planktothrix serta PCC 8927]|uniref:Peptidase C39-like domain-containing protein n=1 Tax=Planktothrix serta PCC 8927 TaxID=671068 RepID=A0A7Z9BMS5_9CYAN|nr:hypothetical protein [Planktothrix serta]VXD17999.1 conserved hypothetical protein [Planktothrix serta PCC 8927]
MVNPEQLKLAEQAITEFEISKVPGVWIGLNKTQIIAEMRSRLVNPFNINQGSQPFCGPAAIVFELIRKNPLAYIQLCRNLFQIGGFHTQSNRWISASIRLQESQGNFQMPQVDWMVLSTLRESENLIFPVEPNGPKFLQNLAGMTKPWEISGWTKEILGYQSVRTLNTYFSGDLSALQEANRIIQSGGVAFALINEFGLILNQNPLIPYPSHWIALLGNLSLNSSQDLISFEIYTWAKKMQIKINLDSLKTHLWEIIIGI